MNKPQQELFQAQTTWFHVFKAMIDSGDVASMGPYAVTVYLVIKSYTNFSTGRSFPSLETIVEKSGISDKQVRRSLIALEEHGYVLKERHGRKNVYKLREKVQMTDGEGRPTAVATWDYLPTTIKAAQAELRKFQLTGKEEGLQIVNIDHLTLNVQVACDTPFQFNVGDIRDPELRKAFESAYATHQKAKRSAS